MRLVSLRIILFCVSLAVLAPSAIADTIGTSSSVWDQFVIWLDSRISLPPG